ncbi:MAG: putative Rossmann fold flavoprotein [Flavobacteriaceae bacterium]|jgi:predicted Rossmann fold flavoprotein
MSKNPKTEYDVIVIGGGSSGMIAAGRAAEMGASVCILEKNDELGKKLKITGGGRCNITNAEFDIKVFLEKFPQAKNFLYSPFSQFSSKDTFDFFESRDLPLVVEAKKRAFPHTQRAYDVYRVLEKYIRKGKVDVYIQNPVVKIQSNEKKNIQSVYTPHGRFFGKKFILATGGFAAPETGSTGDGFKFLKELGHTVSSPNPNVVPLTSNEEWVKNLSGTTWSFLRLSFIQNDKVHVKKLGKILFTHFGISGPLVLNSSYEVRELLEQGDVDASLDFFPDTEFTDLDKRLQKLLDANNKELKNILPDIIHKKISEAIMKRIPGLEPNTKGNSITKEMRRAITHKLKDLRFNISGTLGYDKAVIADGGVLLSEVNFKTMQSAKHDNLYLLGDILNINRPSGGYSLQLCWTTGWIAGTHSAENI